MSLILDALKKSDQERRRDRAPDLQTIHRPPPRPGDTPSRAPWLWGVALLATVNLAALGFWWQWQQRQPAAVPAMTAPPQPLPQPRPQPAMAAPQATAALVPAPTTTPIAAAPAAQPAPVPATAVAPTTAAESPLPVQELWEVPDPVRHALPAMTFSFHVYSENPERRTIIINDRRMRQGDTVGEGVLLEEITEDGVILAVDRHRVHIPVLSDW